MGGLSFSRTVEYYKLKSITIIIKSFLLIQFRSSDLRCLRLKIHVYLCLSSVLDHLKPFLKPLSPEYDLFEPRGLTWPTLDNTMYVFFFFFHVEVQSFNCLRSHRRSTFWAVTLSAFQPPSTLCRGCSEVWLHSVQILNLSIGDNAGHFTLLSVASCCSTKYKRSKPSFIFSESSASPHP